jgi:hypothetical protein
MRIYISVLNIQTYKILVRITPGWEVVDWIHLAQDRDQYWAVVNTVTNLRVP